MKKGAFERLFHFLPFHSHSLYWHRHATCAAAATGELVALESDNALLAAAEIELAVDHIGSRHHIEAGFVEGLQGALVATVTEELSRGNTEEVAAAVPLLAGGKVVVAVAAINGFEVETHRLECREQVGYFGANGLLSVDGDMEGLERAVHNDRLENHALVDIQHGEYHVEVDEGIGRERQLLEYQVLHSRLGLQMLN